ncbi:hypothetical protein [Streptomonospora litoralis]|uniref:Uncharacterized protein n=1 Tax=Streptomonospora litoralis TaxID=2498135 RepID=A0A4P6Q6Q8_9ACTN|nr:hypothetical protein [Streptomonospora litoralis]QBI56458.1 hypothetical protein EKD16_23555 [Streptomonospora litoralis]
MPDAAADEPFRYVVDESSLDFRGLSDEELGDWLDVFNDTLLALRSDDPVAVCSLVFSQECDDGQELWEFLYGVDAPPIPADTRRLLGQLLDRCRSWDDDETGALPDAVKVGDDDVDPAWSLGYALDNAYRRHGTGCVAFTDRRRSWLPVSAGGQEAELCFLVSPEDRPGFWQGLYSRENVPEQRFFDYAPNAFPNLVCAPTLRFGAFDGTYAELRDWVVRALAAIDAHFADAVAACKGQPDRIEAHLGAKGIDASPESPNTRSNPKAIAQRDVEYRGETYHCAWHAKKERHRNRVHFSLPDERLDGRILVGIFTDHLDT